MKIPLIPDRPIAALSEKTIKTIEAVPSVNNTQIALLLLRQINNGSLTYTLRTATPCSTEGITQTFTKKILQALAKILDCPLQDVSNASARVFLPIGPGLGFSPTSELAPPSIQCQLPSSHDPPQQFRREHIPDSQTPTPKRS